MKFKRSPKPVLGLGTFAHAERTVTAQVKLDGPRVEVLACGPEAPPNTEGQPRGVAFDGLAGVLHRFDLPPADAATTEKLIAAQLEARIPGQAEHVRWGWQRDEVSGPVTVLAVARRRLESLAASPGIDPPPALLTTTGMALHRLITAAVAEPDRQNLVVIARLDPHLHLLRYRNGQLDSLEAAEFASGATDDEVATLAAQTWSPALATGDEAPASFTLLADPTPTSETVAAYEKAFAGPYRRADGLLTLQGVADLRPSQLVAIGAAIAAAQPDRAINLATDDAAGLSDAAARPSWRHWALAAAALLLALGLWYASDVKRAERLNAAVEDAGLEAGDLTTLNTDLRVARYLETTGPTFLAILDEFSHNTEGFLIDELRYERNGQFTVRATSRSSDQVNQLAAKLSEMRTLSSVRIRSQAAKDRDQVEYTLVGIPSKRYFAPFAPPAPEPAASDQQAGGNPSQPAGGDS